MTIGGPLTLKSCTASNNQGGYNCNTAFDGVVTGTGGWAYSAQIPAWGAFVLESASTVSGLDILSGVDRGNHRIDDFDIELQVGGTYQKATNVKVTNAEAQIDGARIKLTAQDLLKITFTPVSDVTAVKLNVYGTDASNNNLVLTELTVVGSAAASGEGDHLCAACCMLHVNEEGG